MQRLSLLTLSALAAGLAWPVPAQGQGGEVDGNVLLERIADRYNALPAFCADFEQTLEVTLLGETRRSTGRLCHLEPNLFEMRFRSVSGGEVGRDDRVVSDGRYLWAYFPSIDPGSVTRYDLDGPAGRFDVRREFLDDPTERFTLRTLGTDLVEGEKMVVVKLTPRDTSVHTSQYRSATLWLDPEALLLKQVRIEEPNDSLRTLRFTGFDLAPSLQRSAFVFEVPPGVQVIGS